jgi:hypothetical protein
MEEGYFNFFDECAGILLAEKGVAISKLTRNIEGVAGIQLQPILYPRGNKNAFWRPSTCTRVKASHSEFSPCSRTSASKPASSS